MTREVGVEDKTRARGGLGVQRAAAGRWAIFNIETENRQTHNIFNILTVPTFVVMHENREKCRIFVLGCKWLGMLILWID